MTADWVPSSTRLLKLAYRRGVELLQILNEEPVGNYTMDLGRMLASMYAQGFADGSGARNAAQLEWKLDQYLRRTGEDGYSDEPDTSSDQIH